MASHTEEALIQGVFLSLPLFSNTRRIFEFNIKLRETAPTVATQTTSLKVHRRSRHPPLVPLLTHLV